jgi:hypothetical protein
MAFFSALWLFIGPQSGRTLHSPEQPKLITISDLVRPLSLKEAIALFSREHLIDSSLITDASSSMDTRQRSTNSSPKTTPNLSPRTQLVFAHVLFEGMPAKITVVFGDSGMSVSSEVSEPYPRKLGTNASTDDFAKIAASIAKEIGLPTASTLMYIDYMKGSRQWILGKLQNGVITINIWRVDP